MKLNEPLTEREKNVVALLLQGKSNKQMAQELGVTTRTVEFHNSHIYKKLGVSSRAEALIKLSENHLRETTDKTEGTSFRESTVEKVRETTENGGKPIISMRRITMKKLLPYILVIVSISCLGLFVFLLVYRAGQSGNSKQQIETVQVTSIPTKFMPAQASTLTEIVPTPPNTPTPTSLTKIPPMPGNPALQPPASSPSLLLEMFDGHSVDPAVQQPILSLYRLDTNGNLYHLYTPPARVRWGASGYDVSPDGQWLVFSQAVSANLYKMRTDGSETVRLTNTPDSEIAPVWQVDGKSILYVTYTGDRNEAILARIDASGKPLQTFPVSAPSIQNLLLSPDGQALLFTAADLPSQVPVLFTADLTTGKITRLGLEQGQGGIWSPDGQFAVFMGDPTQGQTMLYNRKDEKISVLETSLELAGAVTVAWTLDGRSLVMEQGQGETREIWLWDLAAKSVKNLTAGARYPLHFLALVGDGSRMLLSASLNGPLAQLCELDIASGSIFPINGLSELTMGVNLVAWLELPPMPESIEPFASNVRVAPEALPTHIPASDAEIWVTIQGSGEEVANVRSGPATTYPVVGTIGAGKGLQAKGISTDHQWIQFRYPHTVSGTAWIYVSLTDYRAKMGSLPEVETIFPTSAP